MDLGCGLDEILQVSSQEEVAEIDEFAVPLVLDVDDAPSVLASADGLAVNDDVALGAHDGEGDHGANDLVMLQFFLVQLVAVERIETDVVVDQFSADLNQGVSRKDIGANGSSNAP